MKTYSIKSQIDPLTTQYKQSDNTVARSLCAYQKFMKWCSGKQIEDYTENVFLTYFSELATKLNMKSSSLFWTYSMIKTLLNTNNGVDITKYSKLRAYLKKQAEHYTPTQSRAFTKEEFDGFLSNACDQKYLGMKIILIIGIFGGCQCEEMVKMEIDDIEDLGTLLYVKVRHGKSKKRTFTITGQDYINIYRKYVALRPSDLNFRRLFLKYKDGKCHRSVVGKNTIGCICKQIAGYLKLPNWKEYTGYCFKKTFYTWQK